MYALGVDSELVHTLVRLIELKDLSTASHTWRVVLYTRTLAESQGLAQDMIERLTHAAALHDVGKIDIPDEILQKPGPLTPEERAIMERHADLGHKRLLELNDRDRVDLDLVRHHHERLDGTGYPDKLRGEQISVSARWFAVIDSFDALTSVRPYRREVGSGAVERAMEILRAESGTRYDPQAVDTFGALLRTGRLGWILEHFNDTVPVRSYEHRGLEPKVVIGQTPTLGPRPA